MHPDTLDRLREAARHLRSFHERLRATVARIPAAEWSLRPTETEWTPLEILEHVAVVERGTVRMVLEGLPDGVPAVERPGAQLTAYDARILTALLDRNVRVEAPPHVRPRGRLAAPDEGVAIIDEWRAKAVAFADAPDRDPATRVARHPVLGDLDGVQWLLMVAGHGERHVRQLEERLAR